MHKTLILATELMHVDQDAVKCAKEIELKTTYQEVTHLQAKLSVTQVMVEAAEKELNRVSPMVNDIEHVNSELRMACFAKDDELVFMHVEVSRLKDVASKLESKEVDMQGALSASENLKKELDKLQGVHTGLVEENV
ncbi:hypothetical protein COP2_013835 [Malus domestica]